MVRGINAAGEESVYSYNGLGALMENQWIIAKNGYGYHGVNADTSDNASVNGNGNGNSKGNGKGNNGNGNGNVKKTSTVIKQFVVDFTSETFAPLMEHEVNGLDYRYVYSDKARLSVVVQGIENGSASVLDDSGELHAYYHCDYLGTTDYLTSAVNSKIISWTSYNEWGEITHNAVLKCGQRELDLVKLYATHDYDSVLDMYYAKARLYDVDNRRFTAVDPILDPSQYDLREYVTDPMQLVQYLYVGNNAVNWIDPNGLEKALVYVANSNLSFEVDTSNASSVVEMMNLYSYSYKSWGFTGTKVFAYSYTQQEMVALINWKNASVDSLLSSIDFQDKTDVRNRTGNYFIKFECETDDGMDQYYVYMPEYGSADYLKMVDNLVIQTTTVTSTAAAIQRIMRDINNSTNVDAISFANFKDLGKYFADLIVLQGYVATKEQHYFRNKLNRVPQTLDDLKLQASEWYLLDAEASLYHMNQEDESDVNSGLSYVKFVHKDGNYEAVYDIYSRQLVTSDMNMGTFNYDGSYVENFLTGAAGHFFTDMLPYYPYGNTPNDPLKDWKSIDASEANKKRYNDLPYNSKIKIDRATFESEWLDAGGMLD